MSARIVIIGGGAIAHSLCAVLGATSDNHVTVITRRPAEWSNCVLAYHGSVVIAGAVAPTSDMAAVGEADLVLIAVPAFAHRALLDRVEPHLRRDTWLGALPAIGGFDTLVQTIIPGHDKVLGSLRSPYNARTIDYGKSVDIGGIVPCLDMVATDPEKRFEAASLIRKLLNIPVRALEPFVLATISPASTIFHPARLLELIDQPDAAEQRFYADWGVVAADHYLAMDRDLVRLRQWLGCDIDGLDAAGHYGTARAEALANRIKTLPGLPDIATPFRDGRLDPQHRFVREDVFFGLSVVLEIARTAGVVVPAIAKARGRLLTVLRR